MQFTHLETKRSGGSLMVEQYQIMWIVEFTHSKFIGQDMSCWFESNPPDIFHDI